MIDKKRFFRLAEYGARYALAVTGAEHEGFQNQQVERTLQESYMIIGIALGRHRPKNCIAWVGCQQEPERISLQEESN
jgi:hypothetical protein